MSFSDSRDVIIGSSVLQHSQERLVTGGVHEPFSLSNSRGEHRRVEDLEDGSSPNSGTKNATATASPSSPISSSLTLSSPISSSPISSSPISSSPKSLQVSFKNTSSNSATDADLLRHRMLTRPVFDQIQVSFFRLVLAPFTLHQHVFYLALQNLREKHTNDFTHYAELLAIQQRKFDDDIDALKIQFEKVLKDVEKRHETKVKLAQKNNSLPKGEEEVSKALFEAKEQALTRIHAENILEMAEANNSLSMVRKATALMAARINVAILCSAAKIDALPIPSTHRHKSTNILTCRKMLV